MGIINILGTEISNKIAAGEVVERPASVVKELVENAIDAGADKISVEIKNGGNTYIKVSDNGCGMEKEDAMVAFLRHATSKISTEDDLNAIYTLGFRGEALSSIGAVSMVDLYTKKKDNPFGTHTVCEGGEIISDEDAGIPDGTTFIVRNLFYNVPARMKFLKKDATEAGYISDIMTRFILSHPEISFKLISNGKQILSSYGDGNLVNCVYSVYGKDYASAMLSVDYSTEFVKVTGLCGKGSTARPNRNYQSFFINARYIKSPLIMRAVEEAYKNQIMIGKFPAIVLNLEINPSLIDINVHPTKLEVKFSNENEVYQAVYHAIKDALYKIADIPEIKTPQTKKNEQKTAFIPDKIISNAQIEIKTEEKPPVKNPAYTSFFEKRLKIVAEPKMFEQRTQADQKPITPIDQSQKIEPIIQPPVAKNTGTIEVKAPEITKEKVKTDFRLVGQIFDTYIIIQLGEEIRLIDQHAAHERLKFEELKTAISKSAVYSQGLVIPVTINLSSVEFAIFSENAELISSLGFEAEDYGNNTVIIRSVPNGFVEEDISALFIEIIQQLSEGKREIITAKRERLLYTIACKAAIKANHKLSEREQAELVECVLNMENINTCPHGRPICVSMSKKEIEKTFKRIV